MNFLNFFFDVHKIRVSILGFVQRAGEADTVPTSGEIWSNREANQHIRRALEHLKGQAFLFTFRSLDQTEV